MAYSPVHRLAALACAGLLASVAGCASVAEDTATARTTVTPATAQTPASTDLAAADGTVTEVAYAVLPVAKPGTENTPDALPMAVASLDDAAVPVSALAEARPVSDAAAATAALAGNSGDAASPVAAAAQSYDTVSGVSYMEPGFDTGEPEGLEQLVATHKIVPIAKPALLSNAVLTTRTGLVPQQAFTRSGTPIDGLITKYAAIYGIPESLLHRVVKRESRYNPKAYNNGHYGLMQIKYATAKSMGFDGPAEGLFDAETNIKYAGKYLRGAWLVADDKNDGAVRLYAAGYYYHAKRKGLLDETGLR